MWSAYKLLKTIDIKIDSQFKAIKCWRNIELKYMS